MHMHSFSACICNAFVNMDRTFAAICNGLREVDLENTENRSNYCRNLNYLLFQIPSKFVDSIVICNEMHDFEGDPKPRKTCFLTIFTMGLLTSSSRRSQTIVNSSKNGAHAYQVMQIAAKMRCAVTNRSK